MKRKYTKRVDLENGMKPVLYYREQCDLLAHLVRDLVGSKATRLISKKLDLSTQAVWDRFWADKEDHV